MLKRNDILHLTRREHHNPSPFLHTKQFSSPPTSPLPPTPPSPLQKKPSKSSLLQKKPSKSSLKSPESSPTRLMNLVSEALSPRKKKRDFNTMFKKKRGDLEPINTTHFLSEFDNNVLALQCKLDAQQCNGNGNGDVDVNGNGNGNGDVDVNGNGNGDVFRYSIDSEHNLVNLYNNISGSDSVYTNNSIDFIEKKEGIFCVLCEKDSIECDTSMVILECMHCIHVDCFINNITKSTISREETSSCIKCSKKIDTDDIKTIFNKYLKNSKIQTDVQMSEISQVNSCINKMTSFVKELYIKYEKHQDHDKQIKDFFLHLVT